MPDYSAWPTAADVRNFLDAMPSLVDTTAKRDLVEVLLAPVIAAVTAEIARDTKRTFIPVSETRYFDGSGTGVQEVDEIVTLTSVALVGWSGATPATLSNVYLEETENYPNTRIAVYQGSLPGAGLYLSAFPQGRRNVKVVGSWGYAATIPADLWLAHLQESAARIAADVIFNPNGRRKSFTVADAISESYLVQLPGEASGWHARYKERVRQYTSPKAGMVGFRRPVMI